MRPAGAHIVPYSALRRFIPARLALVRRSGDASTKRDRPGIIAVRLGYYLMGDAMAPLSEMRALELPPSV